MAEEIAKEIIGWLAIIAIIGCIYWWVRMHTNHIDKG